MVFNKFKQFFLRTFKRQMKRLIEQYEENNNFFNLYQNMIKNQEQQNNQDSTHQPSLNNFTRKNKLTSNKVKRPYDKDDIDSDSSQELLNYPQLNELEDNAEQNDSSQQNDFDSLNYGLSFEEDPTKQVPKEVKDLGKLIEGHGIQMLRIYEMTGRTKEAEQLKLQLEKAMQAKTQLEKISRLDFDRPKQELREAAEKFGIDLNDINVKNEFIKIQRKNINDINQWMQTNDPKDAQQQEDKSKKQKFNKAFNQEQELINQKKKIKKEKFIAEQNKLLVQSIFDDVDRLESTEKIETEAIQVKVFSKVASVISILIIVLTLYLKISQVLFFDKVDL